MAARWGDADTLKNVFTFRDTDVIVNTYPYNGSVTVQHLLLAVLYNGSVEPIGNLRDDSPCLEMSGGGPDGQGAAVVTGKCTGLLKGKGKGGKKGKDKGASTKPGKAWQGDATTYRSAEELNAWNGETKTSPNGPGRRILKTHRPPSSTVWVGGTDAFGTDKAKMIVVTSTPMEALAKMAQKEKEWKHFHFDQKWVESWSAGKEGILAMDWWTWHEEWWKVAKTNPGVLTMCLEDLLNEPLPTLRKLCGQCGIKSSDGVLKKAIEQSFPETMEKIDAWKSLLTPSQAQWVMNLHSKSGVAKVCPFSSSHWKEMLDAKSNMEDVAEIALKPAPSGAIEMRVTTNKSTSFYVKSATSFFEGVQARPAADGQDAAEARPAHNHVRISGLGDAVNVASATATAVERSTVASIIAVQTDYPNMEESRQGCARICIDLVKN